jgi:hypothetical protein
MLMINNHYALFKLPGNLLKTKKKSAPFFRGNMEFPIYLIFFRVFLSQPRLESAKITLYNSIIALHFDYCASLLFLANDGEFANLQKVQNRIMRTILNCRRTTPIKSMLTSLDFWSVKQRVIYNTMTLIYKMEMKLLPDYLCHFLKRVGDFHTYNTRNRNEWARPNFRKNVTQNSLFYSGIKIYNKMKKQSEFETISNLKEFQEKCLRYVKKEFKIQ